jgi:hypothetical protein
MDWDGLRRRHVEDLRKAAVEMYGEGTVRHAAGDTEWLINDERGSLLDEGEIEDDIWLRWEDDAIVEESRAGIDVKEVVESASSGMERTPLPPPPKKQECVDTREAVESADLETEKLPTPSLPPESGTPEEPGVTVAIKHTSAATITEPPLVDLTIHTENNPADPLVQAIGTWDDIIEQGGSQPTLAAAHEILDTTQKGIEFGSATKRKTKSTSGIFEQMNWHKRVSTRKRNLGKEFGF